MQCSCSFIQMQKHMTIASDQQLCLQLDLKFIYYKRSQQNIFLGSSLLFFDRHYDHPSLFPLSPPPIHWILGIVSTSWAQSLYRRRPSSSYHNPCLYIDHLTHHTNPEVKQSKFYLLIFQFKQKEYITTWREKTNASI